MKNPFKKRKNNDGFTLTETLVALAIFAIMALIVATLFASAIRQLTKTHDIDTAIDRQIADAETGAEIGQDNALIYEFDSGDISVDAELRDAGDLEDEMNLRIITVVPTP